MRVDGLAEDDLCEVSVSDITAPFKNNAGCGECGWQIPFGLPAFFRVRYYRMAGYLAKNGFEKALYLFQIGFACLQRVIFI